MSTFKSYRVAHEFVQSNPAPPDKVFPLLCPVREADYLPGWQYRLVYSDSGIAELGCVFATPNTPASKTEEVRSVAETTWVVTEHDPAAFRIAFVWVNPGIAVAEIRIGLASAGDDATQATIRYRYTGLSEDGNRELAAYDKQWFETKMRGWERLMNHYLETGEMGS